MQSQFWDDGFLIARGLFSRGEIQNVLEDCCKTFKTQMVHKGIMKDEYTEFSDFENNMKTLYNQDFQTFLNCGKQNQHQISLHQLSLDNRILNNLKLFGLDTPIISTRPVMFTNSPDLAKKSVNHTVPEHQDWASMQGSINSVVVWIPLVDIDKDLGALKVIPGSHKNGLLSTRKEDSFGILDQNQIEEQFGKSPFIDVPLEQGDALFFSSFLVHKSGENVSDKIRWSAHFRYNDICEESFVDRGYPHAYIYRPVDEILNPEFNTSNSLQEYMRNL